MKSYIKTILVIILTLLLMAVVLACTPSDDPRRSEDYVEATGVRVPNAIVYLSSHGATSSYQLEPSIVPENATNKKLVYYATPEALEYFSLDQTGLITAKKIMDDVDSVPIRIYSSTNPDAYTTVSVIIENVEVEELYFASPEMTVSFPSDPIQLDLLYKPYHAQDGRDVTYTSQNTEIVTVSPTGLMTVVKPGFVTIIARSSTLSGKTLEGRIQIRVGHAAGNYRLDVTDPSPKFDQVVGKPQAITFSILRLNMLSDPNPDIKWYVAGTRILEQNGKTEFKYTPAVDSTRSTFTITVQITPKNEDPIILESPPISLYMPFTGFELQKNEPSGNVYIFGEELTFEPLMANTESYDWYLKKKGATGGGKFIGTTLLSEQNGKLIFTPSEDGDFVLTAKGKSGNVEIMTKDYEFSVIKYVIGDRVQVYPVTNMEEKVPDSFDWYLHRYDPSSQSENIEDGIINKAGTFLFTSVGDATFNYEATEEGWYVISSSPTVDGLPVYQEGGETPERMRRYTTPFRVWEKTGDSNIEYLVIDGAQVEGEYRPVIKWNQLAGANSFIIEVVSNNNIYIIDTSEARNDDRGIVFSDYSIILPLSIATLEQTFSVRVKQKGGVYCDKLTYAEKSIAANHYAFLPYINFSINRYIRDMYEMGELLNYITAYKPAEMLVGKEGGNATYKVNIFTRLIYRNINKTLYPVIGENPYEDDYLSNIYNITTAAINAYAVTNIIDLDFNYFQIDGSFDIIVTISEEEYISQPPTDKELYQFKQNYASGGRPDAYDDFAIHSKNTINATTSDQLFHAVSMGKRPLPTKGSAAEAIYNQAQDILRDIITSGMTEFEKVLAINDYLASNVNKDRALMQYAKMTPEPADLYLFEGYHLDGALLTKSAVSQGFSKAFSLLCWMEGITANVVLGLRSGAPHSWNKVLIGEDWYNVDSFLARVEREDGVAINYAYFLRSDEYMAACGYSAFGDHAAAINGDHSEIEGMALVDSEEQTELEIAYYLYSMTEGLYSFGLEFAQEFNTQKELKDIVLEQLQTVLDEGDKSVKELLQIADRYFVVVLTAPR